MARAPGKRRRLYPMPVECLIDHPHAVTLPSAAYGMLVRLCHHFWTSDCRPLPVGESERRHIARAHAPTWRTWESHITTILDDVLPELEAYFNWRENNRAHLVRIGATGNGVVKLRAINRAARERGQGPSTLTIPRKLTKNAPAPVVPPTSPAGDRKRRSG